MDKFTQFPFRILFVHPALLYRKRETFLHMRGVTTIRPAFVIAFTPAGTANLHYFFRKLPPLLHHFYLSAAGKIEPAKILLASPTSAARASTRESDLSPNQGAR